MILSYNVFFILLLTLILLPIFLNKLIWPGGTCETIGVTLFRRIRKSGVCIVSFKLTVYPFSCQDRYRSFDGNVNIGREWEQ